jgi:hypothetical protein
VFRTFKSARLASMTLALVAIASVVSSHLGHPTVQTVISGVRNTLGFAS